MTLLVILVGALFLTTVISSTAAHVFWQQKYDLQNDVIELKVLLAHTEPTILAADKLANHTVQAAAHRSSDSFTGTVPHRQVEVARNDFLEKTTALTREYRVVKGEMKPKLEINEEEFRDLGTPGTDAPAEIRDGSWRKW